MLKKLFVKTFTLVKGKHTISYLCCNAALSQSFLYILLTQYLQLNLKIMTYQAEANLNVNRKNPDLAIRFLLFLAACSIVAAIYIIASAESQLNKNNISSVETNK